jgi:subtilisin family serine protease
VRLAAPGCNLAPISGGGYGNFCGTSSAAPVVAGLVALELSAQPAATAQEAEDALARAAFPLPALVQYGRIDAGKTLALLHPSSAGSPTRAPCSRKASRPRAPKRCGKTAPSNE